MKKNMLLSFVTLACLLTFIAAGCQVTQQQGKASPASTNPKEVPASRYKAPLTGLETDSEITTRPIMVMVNNHAKARPQSGLTQADIIYEILAEGEITRLVAIYQSQQPKVIGPVRSIRPYFIDVGKSYDAIMVHAGGSPDAYDILQNEKLDHLDEIRNAGPYFWRESFRKPPHNLYTDLTKIHAGISKLGLRTTYQMQNLFFLPEDQTPTGDDAAKIDLTFLLKSYKVTYLYDPQSRVYKRFINGEPHTDLTTDQQLSATNVVVLGADHKVVDDKGRREIHLLGKGKGLLFQRGKVQAVQWERSKNEEPFRLMKDGKEVGLYPGVTHYLIVPNTPSFEQHVHFTRSES
jgi:hypothetical protein